MANRDKARGDGQLAKCPTGIRGLDEITSGGLPRGRSTLVCGSAGCGKTVLAMEFLVRGAVEYNEPGVFMAFEETAEELTENVRSLGFHLDRLASEKKLAVDYVRVERSEIEETGEYDLEGLFIRLAAAIDAVGAKRVVLDTIESLFSGLSNVAILRAELRRLFRWLKQKGVTAIITAERGEGAMTRHGLEEYVSDCVILLDHRVIENISTRRIRIVKYRGSTHGCNEFPFLIEDTGISILPITSLELNHPATDERISSGIPRLDAMLGGKGFFRGTSILVSGTAGTGKTSIASAFAATACARGERVVMFAFEESPSQLVRNMRSIGVDLAPWVKRGLLSIQASRPTLFGLEMHLASIHRRVEEFQPRVVIVDPISNFSATGNGAEVKSMLMRLIDFLKCQQATGLFTSLTAGREAVEQTEGGVSSLMDTWLLLRGVEFAGERNRVLYVLKSRGMAHSNQLREFRMSERGIELVDAYLGPEGVLTGSARLAQEAHEKAAAVAAQAEIQRRQKGLEAKRLLVEQQIAALRATFATEEADVHRILSQEQRQLERIEEDRKQMAWSRQADGAPLTAGLPSAHNRGDGK